MTVRAVAEGLLTGEGPALRLLGGRRKSDGAIVFPLPRGAEAQNFDAVALPNRGTLWSFTVQRFRPKPPFNGDGDDRNFQPYAVGYVALPDAVIVESRLVTDDFANLKIGMPMELTLDPYRHDADGSQIVTYAFRTV
jgi:uncharacterized OB-fold protein